MVKSANMRSGGQRGYTCNKCGKCHEDPCQVGMVCYMCGMEGHFMKDFLKSFRVCFSCNEIGIVKADCPLLASRSVQTPFAATLRITDVPQGKGEALKARWKAFQLTKRRPGHLHTLLLICIYFIFMSIYIFCVLISMLVYVHS